MADLASRIAAHRLSSDEPRVGWDSDASDSS